MDLKSLIAKMTAIEEGAQMAPPSGPEVPIEECGDEMMPGAVEECGMDMPGDMMKICKNKGKTVIANSRQGNSCHPRNGGHWKAHVSKAGVTKPDKQLL